MNKEAILDYVIETPGNTNRNVLGGMLDQFSKDSSGLPEVTSEDNGDVLTVVNGEWAKAEPQGGGEDVELYIVDAPTTDPDAPSDFVSTENLYGGLSLTEDGEALTFADIKRLIDSKSHVKIQNRSVWCFPIGENLVHIEGEVLIAVFVISDHSEGWRKLGVELASPDS